MSLNVQQKYLVTQTENYIKRHFEKDGSGHDWWHIYRVRNLALKIAETEGGDVFIVEMAALLHDLDDWKLTSDNNELKTQNWLKAQNVDSESAHRILEIIEQLSFKGAKVETKAISLEAKIVQDADRLDAIGAIGIARTFAYGGNKNRLIYHPGVKPEMHESFEAYKKTSAPTINHFYEKLLLLKERMNTKTAIKIAEKRHRFMLEFLEQFFGEWDGRDASGN